MKVIVVTGSVGTGKSFLAKKLAKRLKYLYVDINHLIKEKKLYNSYDRKRKSFVVDVKKLNKFLIKLIKNSKKNMAIDSHLSHYLPKTYVDLCIVTKCELKELEKRLKKRGYPRKKIRENLDCEIFDVCLNEANEMGHKIKVIDTTKRVNIDKINL